MESVKSTIKTIQNRTQKNFPIGYQSGKQSVLDKKIPENKNMKKVQNKVTTGTTIKDIEILTNSQVSKRKNELFRRINGKQLKALIEEYDFCENIANLDINQVSDTQSNINVVDIQQEQSVNLNQMSKFLILDLREEDHHQDFNIRESNSFPERFIKQDKFTQQILRYKNKPDKIIIVYNLDEKESIRGANLLAQKGFDNLFMLTEGIEKFAQFYPEMIEGSIPLKISMTKKETRNKVLRKSDKDSLNKQSLLNIDEKMSIATQQSFYSKKTQQSRQSKQTTFYGKFK